MLLKTFSPFDRSKLLFTIIVGLVFFLYDTPYISDTALPPQKNITTESSEPIHPVENNDISIPLTNTTEKNFTLEELLLGFDENYATDYQEVYTTYCSVDTIQCSMIQLQFADNEGKEYYYALVTLFTIKEFNNHLLTNNSIQHNIVLKKEDNTKRGYTSHNVVVINTHQLSDREFFEVLTHELGHIIDLGILQGTSDIKDKNYTEFNKAVFSVDDPSLSYYALSRDSEGLKKQHSTVNDFCTIYGSQNPFEDFSECFNLYINHNQYFTSLTKKNTILQKKYSFIASLLRPKVLSYMINNINYMTNFDQRYRDSTKIYIPTITVQ